jgi:hypothetical protein
MTEGRVGLFGIRHHGPGSARSLLAALDALDPAIVLIEGPADASEMLRYAALADMRPPLAILVYAQDDPANASFYPFAVYSPEWQAMRWALMRGRAVRFIDLPAANNLALRVSPLAVLPHDASTAIAEEDVEPTIPVAEIRRDPLSYLAEIAGYTDGEAWWNALIEQGSNGPEIFAAIEAAMTELRRQLEREPRLTPEEQQREVLREAHMRLAISAALKETTGKVAVVCGAWHVPALRERRTQAEDRALLKEIGRVKIAATWVPWSETRLAAASGYGAGVISPGWYAHVWNSMTRGSGEAASARVFTAAWQVKVAALLRRNGRPAPTASAIEAARLAEALAGIRDLALPGLDEMQAASLATLCLGEPAPMALIKRELVIGRAVGTIAEGVPQMPLAADLAYWQKRLKLKPEALDREVPLDLRSESGLARSRLLHRLTLLCVPWGRLQGAGSSRGTFREVWVLRWEPEFSVALAEALVHGTTIEQAAGNAAIVDARDAGSLAQVSDIVRACLLAALDEAARVAISILQARAAATSDIAALAGAVAPLVTILRYGSARATSVEELRLLVVSLSETVCAGLVYACRMLQAPEADGLRKTLEALDQALTLLDRTETTDAWMRALRSLADDEESDELLRGFAVRALHERNDLPSDVMGKYLGRALSSTVPPLDAGRWLEGFLGEAGDVLLHDAELRAVIGSWMAPLEEETFITILPMLRRAFANLDQTERRRLLDTVISMAVAPTGATVVPAMEADSAPGFAAALPLLLTILGLDGRGRS